MGFEKGSSCQESREIALNSDGFHQEILTLPPVLSRVYAENDGRNKLGLGVYFFFEKSRSVLGLDYVFTVLSVSVSSFALFLHSSSERKKTSAPH